MAYSDKGLKVLKFLLVNFIEHRAFWGNHLEKVVIPDTVSSVEEYNFGAIN